MKMSRRRRVFRPAAGRGKRPRRWVGINVRQNVSQASALADIDVLRLVEVNVDEFAKSDFVVDGCYIHFSILRALVTDPLALQYIVAVRSTTNIGLLGEVLDPFTTDPLDLQYANVLMWGALPIPGLNSSFDSAGAFVSVQTTEEVLHHTIHIKASRKLPRGKHALTLTIASETGDNSVSVRSLGRTNLVG